MVLVLKLRKIGDAHCLVLPKEILARLNVQEGDAVFLTEATGGSYRLTARNPETTRKLKTARSLSRRYRHALKELAK
jgi:putative addiction module antidote